MSEIGQAGVPSFTSRWILLAAFASLLIAGCAVPWVALPDKPRFTEAQLAAVVVGSARRDDVFLLLGAPRPVDDFVRMQARHVVYTWRVQGAVRVLTPAEVEPVALDDRQYLLFLEFDSAGILRYAERVTREAGPDPRTPSCASNGDCVEHTVYHNGSDSMLLDAGSAFTVAAGSVDMAVAQGQCALVLWLDSGSWIRPGGEEGAARGGPGGVFLDYGVAYTSTSWMPGNAYTVLRMDAGERGVRFRNPERYITRKTHTFPFRCVAGQVSWAEIRALGFGESFAVGWTDVPAVAATHRIAGRRQLLLREQ